MMKNLIIFILASFISFNLVSQINCVDDAPALPPVSEIDFEMACDFTSIWENEGEIGIQSLPIITIKVNIHWIEGNCGQMSITDGVKYAQDMINSANWHLQNLDPADPTGPGITGDSRIRYEIYSDPNNPNDLHDGVWFWPDAGPNYSSQYGNVLNIRMIDESSCVTTRRGYACTNFCKSVTMQNAQYAFAQGTTGAWEFGGFLNHEIGHTLNLAHSFSCLNECKDVDLDVYEECNTNNMCDPTGVMM